MEYYSHYDNDYPIGCMAFPEVKYNHPDVGFVTIDTMWWKNESPLHPNICCFATVRTSRIVYAPSICCEIIELIRYQDGMRDEEEIQRSY